MHDSFKLADDVMYHLLKLITIINSKSMDLRFSWQWRFKSALDSWDDRQSFL